MALFDSGLREMKSTATKQMRTNNRLVVSDELVSLADKWLADPRLPQKFQYHFGGDSGWVVIPKGKIVAFVPDRQFREFESGMFYTGLTIANGGVDVEEDDQTLLDQGKTGTYVRVANKPAGVAMYNVYQKIDDRFSGNMPLFLRRSYIELPWIPEKEAADKCKWGHVRGQDLKPGDYLMSDENGNFVKWEEPSVSLVMNDGEPTLVRTGNPLSQRVAQVCAIEQNLPPEGWLKWVTTPENFAVRPWMDRAGWDTNNSGYTAADLGTPDANGNWPGYPFDPSYRDGFPRQEPFGNLYFPRGIKGLTDGSNMQEAFTDELGEITAEAGGGTKFFRLRRGNVVEGTLRVTIGGADAAAYIERFNPVSGLIKLALPVTGYPTGKVVAEYKATGHMPGIPTHWDELGSVGVVRLDLML